MARRWGTADQFHICGERAEQMPAKKRRIDAHEDASKRLISQASNAGLEAVENALTEVGAEVGHCLILLHATGLPENDSDPFDSVIAGSGSEMPEDFEERQKMLVEILLHHARAIGGSLGWNIKVLKLKF